MPNSEKLQEQISKTLLSSNKEEAAKVEEQTKADAQPLLNSLDNSAELKKLREERRFTLQALTEDRAITVNDCRRLFAYAKVLYELGDYKSMV